MILEDGDTVEIEGRTYRVKIGYGQKPKVELVEVI